MRRHILMLVSSYWPQPKHRRGLISAFKEAFSTVGKQDAYGMFGGATERKQ